jgi:hypothetical protein
LLALCTDRALLPRNIIFICLDSNFDPSVIQSVSSGYTDCAILVTNNGFTMIFKYNSFKKTVTTPNLFLVDELQKIEYVLQPVDLAFNGYTALIFCVA